MRIRRAWVEAVILCGAVLSTGSSAGAQECPPEVKAMAPQHGTIRDCSYASLATTLSIQMSGEVPRPGLPEQPYVFSVKVVRAKLESMTRRKDLMAQAEMAKMEKAKAATAPDPGPPVAYAPIESKTIAGGKAWYRKATVWSIGEGANTP